MTPDWLLLRRYAHEDSQAAFATLTARYLNLVYAVCLREVHDPTLAQDAAQAVFLLLARTAPSFRSKTALSGWLFRTARFTAQNARTREERRRHYEEAAAKEYAAMETPAGAEVWAEIEPLLNSSLAALRETDRACLLLRFFQEQSFAEVGASLGLSEDAARKRVTRALDKLRQFFVKEGVAIPAAALAVLLTAHAAKAAPPVLAANLAVLVPGLAAGHLSAALTGSHAYQLSEGALKAMKLAQLKILASGLAVMFVGSIASYGMLHGQATGPKADQKTEYRTVVLTGKVHYNDGKPAAGVKILALLQSAATPKILIGENLNSNPNRVQQLLKNTVRTQQDGTYAVAVGAELPYNVMLFPNSFLSKGEKSDGLEQQWVAIAAQGVSGHNSQKVIVPDLILAPGAIVTGLVTDKTTGEPVAGVRVGSIGSECPESSAAIITTDSDSTGHYRLRVGPGTSKIFVADRRYSGQGTQVSRQHVVVLMEGKEPFVSAIEGQTKIVNLPVTPE